MVSKVGKLEPAETGEFSPGTHSLSFYYYNKLLSPID